MMVGVDPAKIPGASKRVLTMSKLLRVLYVDNRQTRKLVTVLDTV